MPERRGAPRLFSNQGLRNLYRPDSSLDFVENQKRLHELEIALRNKHTKERKDSVISDINYLREIAARKGKSFTEVMHLQEGEFLVEEDQVMLLSSARSVYNYCEGTNLSPSLIKLENPETGDATFSIYISWGDFPLTSESTQLEVLPSYSKPSAEFGE